MNIDPAQAKAKAIFLEAVEKHAPSDWDTYLSKVCGDNTELRRQIMILLEAHQQAGSFLDAPAMGKTVDMPAEPPLAAAPNMQIGPYKLLQQIGVGGMGVVYMAEQAAPVRRKVALKIIKPGMDTREVIARFEAERQALALMDHPNIARVFDGGATEAGRPYFVMELVRGVPITEYCDQNNLPVHERLELFVTVCHAVQHAHQKGIIHRDIKPSNVLVTLHDGRPVPKVIDFGVAKAIGQQLTDKTLFTQFAQMVGTPLYMSPEQAELTGLDIDTRGDIYSLGVLLYELLTGTTPFDGACLKKVALDEIRRMIREEEPPNPSTRLSSTAGVAQTAVAAHRRIDPKGLSRLVRGDLDWIVMKALEKDRNRRYETANGFAADIGRYLSDEPVEACPPSSVYRFRKFARRNRVAFSTAALVLAALVLGMAGTTIGLLQARAERDKVLAAKEKILAAQDKERIALIAAEENLQTARNAVDQMYTRAAEEMRDKPQVEQIRRALLEDALRFYQGFLKRKSADSAVMFETALSHRRVGEIYGFLGDWNASLENHQQATLMLGDLSPQSANDVNFRDEFARAHFHLGYALLTLMQIEEGSANLEEAMEIWESLTKELPNRPSYLEDLARANIVLGRAWIFNFESKGNKYVNRGQELLATLRRTYPGHEISNGFKADLNTLVAWRYSVLPHDTTMLKQLESECRGYITVAEAESRQHPTAPKYDVEVAEWMARLVKVLTALDRLNEAERIIRSVLEIHQRLARQHPGMPAHQKDVAWSHYALGELLYDTDRPDEAAECFRTAIAITSILADKYPENVRSLAHVGGMLNGCPLPQFRNPRRALEISLHVKELRDVGWGDVVVAQIDSGLYREALETCEKSSRARQQAGVFAYAAAIAYWHLGRQADARELLQQMIQQMLTQPNDYWYEPEYRHRTRDAAKLMGLEIEELNAIDPEKTLRNGVALYLKLVADRPGDQGLLQELIRCYTELWQLLSGSGRNDEADQAFNQCVAVSKKLVSEFSNVLDHRQELIRLLLRRGDSLHWTPRIGDAEQPYRDALAESERLVAEFPKVFSYRLQLADCRRSVAWLLSDTGRSQEGEPFAQQAIELATKLDDESPAEPGTRSRLAHSYTVMGLVLERTARPQDAEKAFRHTVAILEPLARESPGERRALALAHRSLALLFATDPNRLTDTQACHRLAAQILENVIAEVPGVSFYRQELATCYNDLYQSLTAQGQVQEADEAFNQYLSVRKKLVADFPNVSDHRLQLADLLIIRGKSLQSARSQEAEAAFREAIKVLEKSLADFPGQVSYHRTLLEETSRTLADLLIAKGRSQEAEELFRETLTVYRQLAEAHPKNLDYRIHLSRTYFDLARILARQGKHADAAVEWENAAAEYSKVIEVAPEVWEAWSDRAFVHFFRERWNDAVADFSKAIELSPQQFGNWWHRGLAYAHLAQWEQAAADFEKVVDQWPAVSDAWYMRGAVLAKLNQPEKALADLRQAVERGFTNVELMKNDSKLDPLRTRDDFAEVLRDLEQKVKLQVK